jgi:hypothetical protein
MRRQWSQIPTVNSKPGTAVEGLPQGRGDRFVGAFDYVRLHPHGHGRVGVAEPAGDGTHIMPAADGSRGCPVPEVVEPPLGVDPGSPAGPTPTPPDAGWARRPGVEREHERRDRLPLGTQRRNFRRRRLVKAKPPPVGRLRRCQRTSGLPRRAIWTSSTALSTMSTSACTSAQCKAASSARRRRMVATSRHLRASCRDE